MKKQFLLFFLFSFIYHFAYSQYTYYRNDSIPFIQNGKQLKNPTVGGFNAPQFNAIDLNMDGILDLLVFDRSGDQVLTFINEGIKDSISYKYAAEYQQHIPYADDFIIARDYNCDGRMDLFIGNSGIIVYENISSNHQLQFKKIKKLQSNYRPTMYNIQPNAADMPGIIDIDGDGDIDIIEPFFLTRQMYAYHRNLSVEKGNICGLNFELRSKCWGDITESFIDATIYLDSCRYPDFPDAEIKGQNPIHPKTNDKSEKHGNAGISLRDIDGNGSMDMLLGDDGTSRIIALYNVDSISPHNNSHIFKYDTTYPSYDKPIDVRLFPTTFFMDVNNDGIEDMIVASNVNSITSPSYARQNIHLYMGTGNKRKPFTYKTNRFLDDNIVDVGRGSYPVFFDYNKDGLEDLVIGNHGILDSNSNKYKGRLVLYENTGTQNHPEYTLVDTDFAHLTTAKVNLGINPNYDQLIPAFYDLDGDGDLDMIVGDNSGRVHYFIDTSASNQAAAFKLKEANMQDISVYNGAAPFIFDVNGDSLGDLVIGSHNQDLQLNLNLGDKTNPIFNLSVQSIHWRAVDTLRYQLRGNPNLTLLKVGDTVDINNCINSNNEVLQTIAKINNTQHYIDLIHPFRTDATDDEINSTSVVDYSIKTFGGILMGKSYGNSDAVPFLFKENNELSMILGSYNGRFLLFDSISNNLDGKFREISDNYIPIPFGSYVSANGTDLNGDGQIDFAIGNEAGGINFVYAKFKLGLNDFNSNTKDKLPHFDLFPNPSKGEFTISTTQIKFPCQLQIFDISGRIVYQQQLQKNKMTINESKLSRGLYFVRLSNNQLNMTQKLVIQR